MKKNFTFICLLFILTNVNVLTNDLLAKKRFKELQSQNNEIIQLLKADSINTKEDNSL